jgi:RNA polymerase sigma-70 factor (ECF subfamily)
LTSSRSEHVTLAKDFPARAAPSDMDERAREIERVYRERYVGFRNVLATVTGDYESARDAVQEGFARAYRERRRFRGEAPIEAWIFRIALRAALAARRNGAEPLGEHDVPSALVDEARVPELAAALRELPPRRRLVVFLRYFADLSYADIATALAISEGTVAASLAQAHDALREALRPEEVRQ